MADVAKAKGVVEQKASGSSLTFDEPASARAERRADMTGIGYECETETEPVVVGGRDWVVEDAHAAHRVD